MGQLHAQDVFEACRNGNLERIKMLMSIKHDTISSRNENGFTPLIIAGYRNQLEVVDFLLNNGVDVNAGSPEGAAIVGAGYKGNLKLATLLIRHKADLNAGNTEGTTALMYAAMGNYIDMVSLLLKAGANKSLKNKSGKTALDLAKHYEFIEIIRLLSSQH